MVTAIEWRRSWWLSFLDHTNLIVIIVTSFVVLLTRSAGVVYFGVGAVMCTLTVKLLKNTIRQPRPLNVMSRQKTTYGMPSTHSATITYYAAYIALASLYLPLHESFPTFRGFRILPPLLSLPCSGIVVLSRIWLGHHTWPQVGAGISYGTLFALVWFKLWCAGLDGYGPHIEKVVNEWVSA